MARVLEFVAALFMCSYATAVWSTAAENSLTVLSLENISKEAPRQIQQLSRLETPEAKIRIAAITFAWYAAYQDASRSTKSGRLPRPSVPEDLIVVSAEEAALMLVNDDKYPVEAAGLLVSYYSEFDTNSKRRHALVRCWSGVEQLHPRKGDKSIEKVQTCIALRKAFELR
jgi:hypothetical protein